MVEKLISHKVKASVLAYALFIMVVITIILSSLILYTYLNHLDRSRFQVENKLRRDVSSGIALLLTDSTLLHYGEQRKISLFGENTDSVWVSKKLWGFYDLLHCRANRKAFTQEQVVLAGAYYNDGFTPALYLADQDKALSVCGNTRISGDCLLPKAGVKRGIVGNRHYTGARLVDGNIKNSKVDLPEREEKFRFNQFSFLKDHYFSEDSTRVLSSEELPDSLYNPFSGKPVLIYGTGNLLLDNQNIAGQVLIMAEGDVFIEKGCQLKDVVVYARRIYIKDGFEGTLQCIASDTLVAGKNCKFFYPSNLALLNDNPSQTHGFLRVGKGSQLEGAVIAHAFQEEYNKSPQVLVEENTTVYGQVYANGLLELKGKVMGTVYAQEFILKKPSVIYFNHLLDVELDITALDKDFVGAHVTGTTKSMKIAKTML